MHKQSMEENKITKTRDVLDDPESKAEAELIKNEINALANSLRASNVLDAETFTFNPFPTPTKSFVSGVSGPVYDDDVIVIDATNTGPKKILKEFEAATEFIGKQPPQKEEKQNILDLMDEFNIGN
eukprot:TRINITY_DN10205_c0_g1_i2.p2 TRINITY_DN10205_c0_g1~~TRINITY_DN10205_c0_g1_i2.p2  ORF type:complete len:126 (-),score=32.76 TRINITY_DN10205_c0_g1_i2:74-451(-)